MRKLFFITLFSNVLGIFAQTNDFKILIDGHVASNKDKGPIFNAHVFLTTDIGTKQVCNSDSNGYYSFRFKNLSFKTGTITVEVDKQTIQINTAKTSLLGSSFLGSKDFGVVEIKESSTNHFTKDFELVYLICNSMSFPSILFKRNSAVFDTIHTSSYSEYDSIMNYPFEAINVIFQILRDNPNLIVQLSAHCSTDEKNPLVLSQKRAQKAADEFVKLGIPKERLVTKGFGNTRLLVKNNVVKLAQTKEEMMILNAKNRRCVFSILSWDYPIAPNKPIDKLEEEKDE